MQAFGGVDVASSLSDLLGMLSLFEFSSLSTIAVLAHAFLIGRAVFVLALGRQSLALTRHSFTVIADRTKALAIGGTVGMLAS